MEKKTIVQRLRRPEKDVLSKAGTYYRILSSVNNLNLTDREIQLIAFTAVRGNISYSTNREEFCNLYNSSSPTINNIISKLKKQSILIKDASKVKVNPKILIDFNKDIILQIILTNGQTN